MRIVVLNSCSFGSTGNIGRYLSEYMASRGHEVLFCYAKGAAPERINSFRFESFPEVLLHIGLCRLTGWQGSFSVIATQRLKKKLKAFQADVYFIENLHGYYINEKMLFRFLGRTNAKVVYLMLDEYAFLGRCDYSFECEGFQSGCGNCKQKNEYPKTWIFDHSAAIYRRKKMCYDMLSHLCFVGIDYTVNRAKTSPMMYGRKFFSADEAIDLRRVYYPRNAQTLGSGLNIPENTRIILCVAPFSDARKGCKYFLEAARLLKEDHTLVFLHIGADVGKKDAPDNYMPIGFVRDQNVLCEYFSIADAVVCTSLAETVPAVCLESLACGTPIIGFDVSGIPYCADSGNGVFVKARDTGALVNAIRNVKKKDETVIRSCREYAKKRYDSISFCEKMEKLAEEMMSDAEK